MQFVTSHGSHRREIGIEINGIHRAAKRTVPDLAAVRAILGADGVQVLSNTVTECVESCGGELAEAQAVSDCFLLNVR
jgi:hypothetical protein